jgi:hypothetical protein
MLHLFLSPLSLAQLLANLADQVRFVKFAVFLIKNDQRLPHAAEYVSQGFFLVFTDYTCLLACLLHKFPR